MSVAVTQTWTVAGMTCAHCVDSVTDEVTELAGVRSVDVVLDSGRLTVTSDSPLGDDLVGEAVAEAGYHLVP